MRKENKYDIFYMDIFVYFAKEGAWMRFVKTEDLVKGMRLAKPIYNKNGVLLYDRDTKLTKQGINSVKNFGIIGIFILEPAEPLPPMTEDDIEFERFQTMSVFGLKEDLDMLLLGKKPANIENLIKIITKNYCKKDKKVNFMQSIRSNEDYVYKHSLNVAIMSAMMGIRLKLNAGDIKSIIHAALVHDVGRLVAKNVTGTPDEIKIQMLAAEQKGLKMLSESKFVTDEVKELLDQKFKLSQTPTLGVKGVDILMGAKVLQVAEVYDDMTTMKIGEEPTSDVVAVRHLLEGVDKYDTRVVGALVDSIKILFPGICVELTNGYTGLVVRGNEDNVLKPMVLCFGDNNLYDLDDKNIFEMVQIKDIMKTMDNRVSIDKATIDEYLKKYS